MPIPIVLQVLAAKKAAKEAAKKAKIQHFTLGSTAISDVWYHGPNEILWVKFRKVKAYPKYRFEGVPGEVLAELLNARSAGSVYHSKIKGNYHSSSITSPEDDDSLSGQIAEQVFNLLN